MAVRGSRSSFAVLALIAASLLLAGCGGVVNSDARKSLETEIGNSTLTVYPVGVLRGADYGTARADVEFIVDGLRASGFKAVVAAPDAPDVTVRWQPSADRMLENMARAVSGYVANHPPKGQYALYAQYQLPAESDTVGGILWVISDRRGRIAAAGIMNAANPRFVERGPVTRKSARAVLIDDVQGQVGTMMAKAGPRR